MAQRNYRTQPRRSRLPGLLLGGLGLFALLVIGIVGTLLIAGIPLNPFASSGPEEDPYMVRIPINAQPIPAYSRVERSHLLNPADGKLMYQRVPPQVAIGMSIVGVDENGSHVESLVKSVKNVNDAVVFVVTEGNEVSQANTFTLGGAIMNINAVMGRVVRADKRAGLGFQESTFFPRGTPEGLAGATPTGMRAITLDATRLTGVHSLNAGDQIDLLASVPTEEFSSTKAGGDTEVQLLAQNAKVLRPVYVRNEVTQSASLMNGQSVQNIPKYEVAIAVAADDVIPLQNALNDQLPITCVAHSMKPEHSDPSEPESTFSDTVRVPVTVRPILAYQVVSRDAFVSPATRTLKTETISRQLADRLGAITSIDDALGSITRQDIPAGRYLRRSDLLKGPPSESDAADEAFEASGGWYQKAADGKQFVAMMQAPADSPSAPAATAVGDRPAITRFIPAGRTAFAIPLNRIYGAEHLQIGDSIDLLVSYSLERLDDSEETESRSDGTVIVRQSESLSPRTTKRTWEETFGNRGEPWFAASDAIVVAPVGFPAPAAALREIERSGGLSRSQVDGKGFDGPPIIIAVESSDVEAVAAALATREALFTVAFHSSEPEVSTASRKIIAIAPESVTAYTKLSDTAWQGNRRRIATRRVATSDRRFADALSPTELSQYYGRVLKVNKSRGAFFTANDFLPSGAEAGIAASARPGFTLLPIADREIEGLDSFVENDRLTILYRAVLQSTATRRLAGEAGIAASAVVAKSVRIVRGSVGGQSVLEVRNDELARLQASIARSLTDRDELDDRSHLVAVGRARGEVESQEGRDEEISEFDPLANVRTTQLIIGGKRTVEVFGGAGL